MKATTASSVDTTLCVYCYRPTSGGRAAHLQCQLAQPCSYCTVPGLCVGCAFAGCPRALHRHCLRRRTGDLRREKTATTCEQHLRGKTKDHAKLFLCTYVAHRISIDEELLYRLQRELPRSWGQVFWYILCHQFFPCNISLLDLPKFADSLPRVPADSALPRSIAATQRELEAAASANKCLWQQLFANFRPPTLRFLQFLPNKRVKLATEEQLIAGEIKNYALKPVHEEFLDKLQQQLRHARAALCGSTPRKSHTTAPRRCRVCEEEDCDETDALLACGLCRTRVHMKCYGVAELPVHEWYCDSCKFGHFSRRLLMKCALCSTTGGAVRPTLQRTSATQAWPNYPYTGKSEQVWAHVFCSLHLRATKNAFSPIDLTKVEPQRFGQLCLGCNSREGACLQCTQRKCHASFHPECGKALFVSTRSKSSLDDVSLYCPRHKPLHLRRVIELKEKRTVEEILAFARLVVRLEEEAAPEVVDKATLFEYVDAFLTETRQAQHQPFQIHVKHGLNKLRCKIEVSRPRRVNLLEPETLLAKKLTFGLARKPEDVYRVYKDQVYDVMKAELALLQQPEVFCSLRTKRRREPQLTVPQPPRRGVTQETFCVCRRPFVENEAPLLYETEEEFQTRTQANAMIACDQCDQWFHYACLGLPFDYKPNSWKCPHCTDQQP